MLGRSHIERYALAVQGSGAEVRANAVALSPAG